jgi:hypothetical protein
MDGVSWFSFTDSTTLPLDWQIMYQHFFKI